MENNYINSDTITALSTASGKAAISVIRVSGEEAFSIVNEIFTRQDENHKRFDKVQLGHISDEGEIIDEALCTFFKAPNSYTGEDVVEISVHGNPLIVQNVISLLLDYDVRLALPGEFTYRAYINGKKDLVQAEAVNLLINGKTDLAVRAALNDVNGAFSKRINLIKEKITNLLVHLEAELDYPDEEIPIMEDSQKERAIKEISAITRNLRDSYKISSILQAGAKAVIIGKPNVGKSSLLNALVGQERAIVTDIAGTTRDTIEGSIDCNGIPLKVIDTAGLHDGSSDIIETLGQDRTRQAIGSADILIWVLDASQALDDFDMKVYKEIEKQNFKKDIFILLNKTDLPKKINEPEISKMAPHGKIFEISALNFTGVDELKKSISQSLGLRDDADEIMMVTARHWDLLNQASLALERAEDIIIKKEGDEIASFEIRLALKAFESMLGIDVEFDIVGGIFSTFCIGK